MTAAGTTRPFEAGAPKRRQAAPATELSQALYGAQDREIPVRVDPDEGIKVTKKVIVIYSIEMGDGRLHCLENIVRRAEHQCDGREEEDARAEFLTAVDQIRNDRS